MTEKLIQDLPSKNRQMQILIQSLPRIAASEANVLIQGESGTGKEILAKHIHRLGPRASRPLLAINCSAIPDGLLESEFFGHRKGSFTGAFSHHKGIFEAAMGGTVFLDEIGDMPLHLQSKLLRVLQERTVRPVGAAFEHKVDFTIIAATHKNLKNEIKNGRFREDLYYRLNVIPVTLPALRQRCEDIPELVAKLTRQISKKYSDGKLIVFTPEALASLKSRPWPGNIRELENYVERTVILNLNKTHIDASDLPEAEGYQEEVLPFVSFKELPTLLDLEDSYIRYVLGRVNLHQGKAAEILGVSKRTISRKMNDGSFLATKSI